MKNKAVILGTGGHARTVLKILIENDSHEILGLFELNKYIKNEEILGCKVMGHVDNIKKKIKNIDKIDYYLAIGDNELRKKWWNRLIDGKKNLPNLISKNSHVDLTAGMLFGNTICAGVYIGPEVQIGSNNIINTGAIIEHEVRISDNNHIAPGSIVAGRAVINDDCFVGAGAVIINNIHIEKETLIGAGSTMVKSNIGRPGKYLGTPAKWVSI